MAILATAQRPAGNKVLQRLPVEKLHGNERPSVVFADFMDGADVRVIQGGSSLRLALEAAQSLRVWRKTVAQELQGNEAVELGVLRSIDDTHTAATELFEDAVMRDGLANHGERLTQSFTLNQVNVWEASVRRDVDDGYVIPAHRRHNHK